MKTPGKSLQALRELQLLKKSQKKEHAEFPIQGKTIIPEKIHKKISEDDRYNKSCIQPREKEKALWSGM